MTSRERVLAALCHRQPDSVPRWLYEEAIGYTPPVERLFWQHRRSLPPRDFFGMEQLLVDMVERPPFAHLFFERVAVVQKAMAGQFARAGADIVIQPECMNPAALKQQYGERLWYWGMVSVQNTMPLGSPAEVRAEVGARIREVGQGGGLILSPAHVLSPEVPWENIVGFFDAASDPL